MNPILKDVLSRLDGTREVSRGWMARCPAHEDSDPSLLVSEGDVHPVTLHCFAGCLTEDVAQSIGLEPSDLCADNSDLEQTIRRKSRKAPRPKRSLSDEEWKRRCELWKQMTWGELVMLDVCRRRRIDARERRSRQWFDYWDEQEEELYDRVATRTETQT